MRKLLLFVGIIALFSAASAFIIPHPVNAAHSAREALMKSRYPHSICQEFNDPDNAGAIVWRTLTIGSLVGQGYTYTGTTYQCIDDGYFHVSVCINYTGTPNISSLSETSDYVVKFDPNMSKQEAETFVATLKIPGLVVSSEVGKDYIRFIYKK